MGLTRILPIIVALCGTLSGVLGLQLSQQPEFPENSFSENGFSQSAPAEEGLINDEHLENELVADESFQNEISENGAVCVSIAVYEPAPWIDLMLANVFKFTEATTRVALHLDAKTQYNETDVQRWNSSRVAVTNERVYVNPFEGSIFYAHMLNAQTMANRWGNDCKFFVLQASNMMWVRSGMERQVRTRRLSPLGIHPKGRGCAENGDAPYVGFTDKLGAPKQLYGWGQPEGSFFPFDDVMKCRSLMQSYLDEIGDDGQAIIRAKCYFENTWLQTYMLNYAELPEDPDTYSVKKFSPLSRNSLKYGDKENDAVPLEELEKVRWGAKGFEGYYAVKRVNRNLEHNTTEYIASLSDWERQ